MSQPQSPATDIPGRGIFVGGEAQIERLHHLLVESTPRVLFLHGLAGAGKTTLINQFALGERQQSDAAVLKVDGREIEPTQTGFLAAVLEALDFTTDEPASLEQTMASLQTIAEKVVLSVDHYELLRLLDTWLRLEFVPRLPASVSLLLAGREQPNPAWSRLPAGTFESMTLEPLGPEDSARLLRELGVDDQHVATIARFASGHPLTLVLAALTAKERPAEPVRDITMAKLFDQFTAAYLGALDAETTKIL